ncbi:MAG: glycosyltransferase family 2 protein [Desertimonas sp.]
MSVVIPTVGRRSLEAAVASAQAQTIAPDEIVVVDDRPPGGEPLDVASRRAGVVPVHVVVTGGGVGAAAARMIGVDAATAELIAFLDDDDEWMPEKLASQLVRFDHERAHVEHPVVGALAVDVDEAGDVAAWPRPSRFEPGRDDLAEALFVRRRSLSAGGRLSLGSSVILADRRLLLADPMDSGLTVHEDWEWLLRVDARDDARVSVVDRVLVRYRLADVSLSSCANAWHDTRELARCRPMSARARGDLLITVGATAAVGARAWRDAFGLVAEARRAGRPTRRAWLALALETVVAPLPPTWRQRCWVRRDRRSS